MGCGISKIIKVHEVSQPSEVSKKDSPPKISIMPTEPISIDRKLPKGYLIDSANNFTEPNEEEPNSTDEVFL